MNKQRSYALIRHLKGYYNSTMQLTLAFAVGFLSMRFLPFYSNSLERHVDIFFALCGCYAFGLSIVAVAVIALICVTGKISKHELSVILDETKRG